MLKMANDLEKNKEEFKVEVEQTEEAKSLVEELSNYGDDYKDYSGRITPYHIFFNDFSDDIIDMDLQEAISFCIEKLVEIDEKYRDFPQYNRLTKESFEDFRKEIEESSDSLEIIYLIKEMMR